VFVFSFIKYYNYVILVFCLLKLPEVVGHLL